MVINLRLSPPLANFWVLPQKERESLSIEHLPFQKNFIVLLNRLWLHLVDSYPECSFFSY